MYPEEFERWREITNSSRYRWVEDTVTRLNGRGQLYYSGGDSGVYMRITKDGVLQAGTYEGAIPNIGEALFTVKTEKKCGSFDEAFKLACEVGGRKFLADMFSNSQLPQEVESVSMGQGPTMQM